MASLNSGRRKPSEWSSGAGRDEELPPQLVFREWLLCPLCFEMGGSKLTWQILMNIFRKLDFTNMKHTHTPWIYGEQARQPKFCQRRGLNSPEGWFWRLPVVLVKLRGRKGFFRSSCRSLCLCTDASCSACLWKYNLFHCRLKTEDLAYLSGSISRDLRRPFSAQELLKVTSPTSTLAWKLSNKAHFQIEFPLVGSWWNARDYMWVLFLIVYLKHLCPEFLRTFKSTV